MKAILITVFLAIFPWSTSSFAVDQILSLSVTSDVDMLAAPDGIKISVLKASNEAKFTFMDESVINNKKWVKVALEGWIKKASITQVKGTAGIVAVKIKKENLLVAQNKAVIAVILQRTQMESIDINKNWAKVRMLGWLPAGQTNYSRQETITDKEMPTSQTQESGSPQDVKTTTISTLQTPKEMPTSQNQESGKSGFELAIAFLLIFVGYKIYAAMYFNGEKFQIIKNSIGQYTKNCNDLNHHIEDLKSYYFKIKSFDYGNNQLYDNSNYNMKRTRWTEEVKNNRIHNCSASVCKNASNQPFKYLCKYFDIKVNEETLLSFEEVLNNFAAAEQGKILLKTERDEIVSSISNSIPAIIMYFSRERVIQELGFSNIDLSDLYFPVYTFQYVSAGGNSSFRCDIKLNIENLDKFIAYLSNLIKFKNSIAGQRALMSSALREKIKVRDNFTCKICNLSVADEKNLLLEIDHIIPLAKGGITSVDNLQTLCWKCNRSKGSKVISV